MGVIVSLVYEKNMAISGVSILAIQLPVFLGAELPCHEWLFVYR
jgi:hypothetical protein